MSMTFSTDVVINGSLSGAGVTALMPIRLSMNVNNSSLSSYSTTITNSGITANHVATGYNFVPSSGDVSFGSNISVTTAAGSATVSTTIKGVGTLYIQLELPTDMS